MDEIKLRYFASVARHLSFSKAAKECHVVQSTISRQIAALEQELGVQLFIRDTQNVRLTDAGSRLALSTHNYTAQYQAINENIRNLLHHTESRLQLTVGPYEFPLVPQLLKLFRQKRPEMALHPLLNRYDRLMSHLRAGTINLAVAIKPCTEELPDCQYLSQGTYQWKVAAHRDEPFWQLPPEKRAVLSDQYVLVAPVNDVDPVRSYCRRQGMEIKGHAYSGSFNLSCAQIQAGGCLAVLPEYMEPWLQPDIRMEQVFRQPLEMEAVLIYNPGSPHRLDREFFEYIKENFKP